MLVIIMFIAITVFVVLNGINQSVKNEKREKMLKEIKMEQLEKEADEMLLNDAKEFYGIEFKNVDELEKYLDELIANDEHNANNK